MRMDYTILRIDDHSGRKSMLAEGTAEPVAQPAMVESEPFSQEIPALSQRPDCYQGFLRKFAS